MIARFDPLLLLLCIVFLRGQLVICKCNCAKECPGNEECQPCPTYLCTAPSPTPATCNCSTQTPLQTITNPPPTTAEEDPYTTKNNVIPSLSPNSSTLVSKCPTFVTTDCPKCSTISSLVTALSYPDYTGKIVQNCTLSSAIQAPSPGSIIGATVGGAVFGSILTVIVFVYIRRKSHSPDDIKHELTPTVLRNAAYNNVDDPTPTNSTYSEIHHNTTRKAARISPVMRQEDTIKKEEIYNHLHESDKEDRIDYYDHAGPAPSLSVMEDGYGVLSVERECNENYNMVETTYSTDCGKLMTAENKQSNDYFILETQNE